MDKLQSFIETTCRFLDIDIEKFMTADHFSGSLGTYLYSEKIFNVIKNLKEGNEDIAWKNARALVTVILDNLNMKRMDSKDLYETGMYLIQVSSFLDVCKDKENGFSDAWKSELLDISLLSNEEKNSDSLEKDYPFSLKENVSKIIQSGEIKLRRLRGSEKLPLVFDMEISRDFILTDHITELIKSVKPYTDDKVRIYTMFNIDDIIDFSYFIVLINYHDTYWIVSDEPRFASPSAKYSVASRGAARYRQGNFDKTIFPYIYIDEIVELRKAERAVAKTQNRVELYKKQLMDWPAVCRIMFYLFLNEMFLKIRREPNLPLVNFVSEYMNENQMLLEAKSISELAGSSESKKHGIADVVSDIRFRSTLPVKADIDTVRTNLSVFSKNLVTEKEYSELANWSEKQNLFKKLEQELELTDSEKESDIRKMNRLISDNLSNMIPTLLSYDHIQLFVYDSRVESYKDETRDFIDGIPFVLTDIINYAEHYSFNIMGRFGEDSYGVCTQCGKSHINKTHHTCLRINHHAILSWLSGVTRDKLPFYFRNYMSYGYWPYYGNPLLDNVNPLHRLQDKLSGRYPNGILFDIAMCKRCRNKIVKEKHSEICIVIDHETGQEIERLDRETFMLKYKKTDKK